MGIRELYSHVGNLPTRYRECPAYVNRRIPSAGKQVISDLGDELFIKG